MCGDIQLVSSNIDLLQFSDKQREWLNSFGFTEGISIGYDELDGYVQSMFGGQQYTYMQDVTLLGNIDGHNNIFTIPNGQYFVYTSLLKIVVYWNGIKQLFNGDYVLGPSNNGVYNSIILMVAPSQQYNYCRLLCEKLMTNVNTHQLRLLTEANGDIDGNGTGLLVVGLDGYLLPPLADGYLNWNGSEWLLSPISSFSGGAAGGDLTGIYPNPTLIAVGGAGTYGDGYHYPIITTDSKGRVISVSLQLVPSGFTAGGDLSGSPNNQEVIGIDGYILPTLSIGNLSWTGSTWAYTSYPSTLPPSGPAGGDLSGTYPNPKVIQLDGYAIPSFTPGYLNYNGVSLAFTSLPTSLPPSGPAGGMLQGAYPNPQLSFAGTAGTYGDGYNYPIITTDGYGRVTSVTTDALPTSLPPSGAAGGILTGNYPNPILVSSGVIAGTYGDSAHYAEVTVDGYGRITFASQAALPTSLPPNGSASGDLSGSYPSPTVIKLDGYSIPPLIVDGYMRWNNISHNWELDTITIPTSLPPNGAAGGDLTGTYPDPTVAKIQGNSVSSTGPTAGQFLIENSGATGSAWTLISGDISASISIPGKLTVTGLDGYVLPTFGFTSGYLEWTGASLSLNQISTESSDLWFHQDASSISGYETLQPIPANGTQQDNSVSLTTNGTAVAIDVPHATIPPLPGVVTIPVGNWVFNMWHYIAGGGGAISVTFEYEVFSRTTGGVETLQFTVTGPTLTSTSPATSTLYTTTYALTSAITINNTDVIVIKVFATRNAGGTTTAHWVYEGTVNPSYIVTSFTSQAATTPSNNGLMYVNNSIYGAVSATDRHMYVSNSSGLPAAVTISGDGYVVNDTGTWKNTGLDGYTLPALSSGYFNWNGSAWALTDCQLLYPLMAVLGAICQDLIPIQQ